MTHPNLSKRKFYLFCQGKNWPVSGRYFATEHDIIDRLKQSEDSAERVTRVSAYFCPLYAWQSAAGNVQHVFIVLQSKNWFWSVESFGDVVTVQKFPAKAQVKGNFRGDERVQPVAGADHKIGLPAGASVLEAIRFILEEKIACRPYSHIQFKPKKFKSSNGAAGKAVESGELVAEQTVTDKLSEQTNEPPKAEVMPVSSTNAETVQEATKDVVHLETQEIETELSTVAAVGVIDEHQISGQSIDESAQVSHVADVIVLQSDTAGQETSSESPSPSEASQTVEVARSPEPPAVPTAEVRTSPASSAGSKKKKKKKNKNSGILV